MYLYTLPCYRIADKSRRNPFCRVNLLDAPHVGLDRATTLSGAK